MSVQAVAALTSATSSIRIGCEQLNPAARKRIWGRLRGSLRRFRKLPCGDRVHGSATIKLELLTAKNVRATAVVNESEIVLFDGVRCHALEIPNNELTGSFIFQTEGWPPCLVWQLCAAMRQTRVVPLDLGWKPECSQ
jgi:hypothetical protein